ARRAARWARDNMAILSVYEPEMPAGLHDRAEDNLRILFAIAEQAGGDWPERLRGASLELYANIPDAAEHGGIQLLDDVRAIFAEEGEPAGLATAVLIEKIVALENRPWGTWNKGKPISPYQISKLLRPFNVAPKQFKVGETKTRGYLLEHLQDAFS